jgi:hypothetical protein
MAACGGVCMNISYEEAISRCWAEVDLSQLVQNYRKCNKLEKELIAMLVEKASEDLLSDKNNTINQFISSLLK